MLVLTSGLLFVCGILFLIVFFMTWRLRHALGDFWKKIASLGLALLSAISLILLAFSILENAN